MNGMRLLFLSGLLSLAAGAAVLAAKDQPATRPPADPSTNPTNPVNALCAVEPEHDVDPRVTLVHEGKVIGFCCPDCVNDFEKAPKRYTRDLK